MRTRLAFAALGPALVLVWHLAATANHWRLQKIASELISAKEFFGAPGPNHAGAKFFFAQTSDKGVDAYLLDVVSGKTKFLYEHEQSHLEGVGLVGWSPDDKMFVYSLRSPEGQLIICDGDSGEKIATISESKIIESGVWLSNSELVYVNKDQNFTVVRNSGNEWHKGALFSKRAKDISKEDLINKETNAISAKPRSRNSPKEPITHLSAMSDNRVAWQQGGRIWDCEVGGDSPAKIWESTTNVLLDFYFSRARQTFRLHCKDSNGEFLATFYPASIWHTERLADFERIGSADAPTMVLDFIQDGARYVSLNRHSTFDELFVSATNGSPSVHWDSVDSIASTDSHLFLTGSLTNGPSGIWDYDIITRSLNCAVPGIDHPFRYASITLPTDESVITPGGQGKSFRLWPPKGFVPGKKYPLVVGFSGRKWRPQEASIPNAGSFFASFIGSQSEDWQQTAIAVFDELAQNKSIDTNRVYLVGVSAGASVVGRLLEQRPELWRGAILFSPVSFPKPSRIKATKILVDSGGNDSYLKNSGGIKVLTEFQENAAKDEIPVILSVHPNASHVFRSTIAERERIQQVLQFLDSD